MAMDDLGPITQDLVARIYTDAMARVEKIESGELDAWQALNDQTVQMTDAIVRAIAQLEVRLGPTE